VWAKKANRYQLQTKHGILENQNPTRELLGVPDDCHVSIDGIIPTVEAPSTTIRKWESRATAKDRAQDVAMQTNYMQPSVYYHSDDRVRKFV